ncbi:MAG TPA: aminotransferase class V-fold PLP-dependent enzyme [Nitrospirota bacterium]
MDNIIESYRREFPITGKYIYLDHAGVSPMPLRVRLAVDTFLSESVAAGAFQYPKWAQQIVEVRRSCAGLINADPDEIAFVKSTSHGLSIVANGLDWKRGDNLLVYEKEFPSNLYPWLSLEQRGVEVRFIPSRDGRILISDIEQLIDARTRLISISSVQFTNGFRVDLRKIGDICVKRGILLCVDAIQSLGIIPMDVREYHIDFLSADAHKWLLGPEGIGIFFCRRELAERLAPPLVGWKSVEREFDFERPEFRLKTTALRFEEGSMNLMGIFGLGAAIELLSEVGISAINSRVLDLGDLIIREAEKRGYSVLTPKSREDRGGNITIAGPFNPAQMRDKLREKGIMVNVRGGGLRISPHFYNSEEEIEKTFSIVGAL